MAVWLEFYNIIMPIQVIEKKYRGGFAAYKKDNMEHFHPANGDNLPYAWHDQYLCRVHGAMNTDDLHLRLQQLESQMAIDVLETVNGDKQLKDVYVSGQYLGSHYPCRWIATGSMFAEQSGDIEENFFQYPCDFAFMKGTTPGRLEPLGWHVDEYHTDGDFLDFP